MLQTYRTDMFTTVKNLTKTIQNDSSASSVLKNLSLNLHLENNLHE